MKVLLPLLAGLYAAEALLQPVRRSQERSLRFHLDQNTPASVADVDPAVLYPAHSLSVPIDHFHNDSQYAPHSSGSFNLRYWFDAKYYKPGGPVIMLSAGETDGAGRLPFLQKGIVAILAEATNGLGVILEHRYYGESFPVGDLTVPNLRFLTTDQALADTAYFAKNVVFPGLEQYNLTAPNTAWIAYGGSYAGGFCAFLRKLYPEVFWGGISSSGVTAAIWDYWEYFMPIIKYGPSTCIKVTQVVTNVADNILLHNKKYINELKNVWGLGNITYNDDFAATLANGIYSWQSRNWDPKVGSRRFEQYCSNITSGDVLYPATARLNKTVTSLIKAGGHGDKAAYLTPRMLNYIGWINSTYVAPCARGGQTQNQCFGTHNASMAYNYTDTSLEAGEAWRSWAYQYCTQWGYLQTGSGAPRNILPIISRTVDLQYTSIICREAFGFTKPANVTAINKYGGFKISYPRLAHIGGEVDPWRPASVMAESQPQRPSTPSEPWILIEGAVHHWDENGVFKNETTPTFPPPQVQDAQQKMKLFVQAWVEEFKRARK